MGNSKTTIGVNKVEINFLDGFHYGIPPIEYSNYDVNYNYKGELKKKNKNNNNSSTPAGNGMLCM